MPLRLDNYKILVFPQTWFNIKTSLYWRLQESHNKSAGAEETVCLLSLSILKLKKLFVYCPCLSWSWRNCLFIVPVYPEAEETVCLLFLSILKLKKVFVYCSCLSWSWRNCLFIVPVYPEAEETVCLSSLSIMKYSETCLNQTFLGPTFVFVINRILVYTGKIYKDIILWDYI
jgi:hypothetical protein